VTGREAEEAVGAETWKLRAKCVSVGLNSNTPMRMENGEKVKRLMMA